MNRDDPYFGSSSDRTVILPTPGGRRPGSSARQENRLSNSASPSPDNLLASVPPASGIRGINRLAEAAGTLLSLVGQLQGTTTHPDIDTLRAHVEQEVKGFEKAARAGGADTETISTARYVLCTLIDETVLGTPWGNESIWSEQTLLAKFHREAWGGEKFFTILDYLLREPAGHIDLLELMYLCLAMGFEGKYRVQEQGSRKLESTQENLYYTIREIRGDFERDLSPNWRGLEDRRNPLVRYVPLWVLGAVLGCLLVAIFIGFRVGLNRTTDPLFEQLSAIGRDSTALAPLPQVGAVAPTPAPSESQSPAPSGTHFPGLAELLSPEIRAGLIAISDQADKSRLVIQGDGLFRSGSATVEEKYLPVLQRIGEALQQVTGRIQVVGHTDNVPIRSLRFHSNWDLSKQRAVSVASLLENVTGNRNRIFSEGRADTEPLVPNDTAANRARNRRVEIMVFKGSGNV